MAKDKQIIVGLDIGTTKICCVVAEAGQEGVEIIGLGTYPSRGLRKGVVVNIESTVESIKNAVEEAELMAGLEIESVYVGIAGGHIKGFNSHGVIAVKSNEVTQTDVDRVIEAAKAVNIPMDREVIHVLSQDYIVDDQDGIDAPVGMNGVRLEAKVHIITGAVTSAQNIIRSVNRAGLEVDDIVVEQLASSEAVLDQDEKELGVGLIDMGGGTSDIAIFMNGSIKSTAVVAIGGNHLTNDVAIGLRTPNHEAEKIKKMYGCATTAMISEDEVIEVPGVGGRDARQLSRRVLADIIEPRVAEMFSLIKREIELTGFTDKKKVASGLVLTGGASIMEGMPEMAEAIFDMPIRRGTPKGVKGLMDLVNSPLYATAVGLVLFGYKDLLSGRIHKLRGRNMFDKVLGRMKEWVKEFF
ncbi:Cell division protein FtsA [hydrothermal vent metagenome]|uniref:Cell division protein FtsA n=1 Tax=hydrothermal vent metagenome TaxID=652676 RepID=A0A3B1B921_9ZZZZ